MCAPYNLLQAWLRSRGSDSTTVYTSDTIAEQFGVVKSSYEAVALPSRSVLSAVCKGAGKPQQQLEVVSRPLPPDLEWGQVIFRAPVFAATATHDQPVDTWYTFCVAQSL
eukprot:GHUV01037781.1.p1 GENE.GHUV01037781.1~~GHUV01037781.1.p1  ORF type:complete len:110 (-),score=33.44 GHUV01037781.1:574-903(-)